MTHSSLIELRPLRPQDYSAWLTSFEERLPAQSVYDTGKIDMSECTEEWFANLVTHHQRLRAADQQYILGIFRVTDGAHLGMLDLITLSRDQFAWGELGYFIHNQFWRNGYALAAIQQVLQKNADYFGYHRLEAHISPLNHPSQELLKKAGFYAEGLRSHFRFEDGAWQDQTIFVKLDSAISPETFEKNQSKKAFLD